MFQNIPGEMRVYQQWVVWRLEHKPGAEKPTKVPYNVRTGFKASVQNPMDWATFEEVAFLTFTCTEPVEPTVPVSVSGFSGIGFVFTQADPFAGIDLDDTKGDADAYAIQHKIYTEFDSYSELSQSGKGLHVIVKGSVPHGRKRSNIEVYSNERYFALTGNVFGSKFVIKERQELLTLLWEQMGGPAKEYTYEGDGEEKQTDEEIIQIASQAVNGEKFQKLLNGQWAELYPSQSEADFAFVDIVAFYTQNRAQIARIFRNSALGSTPKDNYAHRGDRAQYVKYMVDKSFDRQLPPIDMEGFNLQFEEMMAKQQEAVKVFEPSSIDELRTYQAPITKPRDGVFPPGLVGDVAQYIFDNSPTPIEEIALAGAIGFVAGICGRAYNISATGLNQYVLLLAKTGAGKEAMSAGISNLIEAIKTSVPAIMDFKGPGQIPSAPGLIRAFETKASFFSIISEFGLKLKAWDNDRNPTGNSIKAALLEFYNKSGQSNTFDGSAYSDRAKNMPTLIAPALTIIGESTPESFYGNLDENIVTSGLLPRFLIIEYSGLNRYYDPDHKKIAPPFYLVENLSTLAGICLGRAAQNTVQNIDVAPDAKESFNKFSRFATDQTNFNEMSVAKELWNRANIKALKLAGLIAVGINPINPVVTIDIADNTIALVKTEIEKLIARFNSNEIGQTVVGSSETGQMRDLVRVIREYKTKPFEFWGKYGITEKMYLEGVIPLQAIQRRLVAVASYRLDKIGATNAIHKQVKNLLDADDLREVPGTQMQLKFGCKPKAFVVANPARFIEAAKAG